MTSRSAGVRGGGGGRKKQNQKILLTWNPVTGKIDFKNESKTKTFSDTYQQKCTNINAERKQY